MVEESMVGSELESRLRDIGLVYYKREWVLG